jgi:hypothetical protein
MRLPLSRFGKGSPEVPIPIRSDNRGQKNTDELPVARIGITCPKDITLFDDALFVNTHVQ